MLRLLMALMRNMATMTLLAMLIITKVNFLDLNDYVHFSSILRTRTRRSGRIHAPKRIVSIDSDSLCQPVFLLAYALISLNSREDTTNITLG